jgi:S-adenosylmethionine:tRNA ribosyltransferase-isomerase
MALDRKTGTTLWEKEAPAKALEKVHQVGNAAQPSPAADADGVVTAQRGWTSHVVSRAAPLRVVDGLITGWHEPDASHLLLLEAIAGRPLLERSYAAAAAHGYRWHEFGDVHLILR